MKGNLGNKIVFLPAPECSEAHGIPYLACFSRYFPDRKYGCFRADDFLHITINIDLGV